MGKLVLEAQRGRVELTDKFHAVDGLAPGTLGGSGSRGRAKREGEGEQGPRCAQGAMGAVHFGSGGQIDGAGAYRMDPRLTSIVASMSERRPGGIGGRIVLRGAAPCYITAP